MSTDTMMQGDTASNGMGTEVDAGAWSSTGPDVFDRSVVEGR